MQKEMYLRKSKFVLTYEDMITAGIERTESSKNEILLASRYFNEIIINNILRKAKSGINVKVVATKTTLVDQFFEQNNKYLQVNDKKYCECTNVVGIPWYPSNVTRQWLMYQSLSEKSSSVICYPSTGKM